MQSFERIDGREKEEELKFFREVAPTNLLIINLSSQFSWL